MDKYFRGTTEVKMSRTVYLVFLGPLLGDENYCFYLFFFNIVLTMKQFCWKK